MMAKALIGAGASKMYLLGRRKDVLDSAASQQEGLVPVTCDVTSKDSLQAAVDRITSDTGYVNLLVANAGVLGPTKKLNHNLSIQDLRKSMFEDVSVDDFTNTLNVNVTGAYFTMLAFLELLDAGNKNALKGGFGAPLNSSGSVPSIQSQVIFTSSVGAYSRDWLSPPAYSGSKAALSHLAKHASTNLSKYEIRVNVLAPGCKLQPAGPSTSLLSWLTMGPNLVFPSDISSDLTSKRDPESESHGDRLYIPSRRFGGIEEIGGSVLYLASRAGSYCNGLILLNDGGRLAVMISEY
jgi:NAD(P)-dependent dehydrogenase (short-subunit alcohol dehydrogenase family)